MSVIALSSEDSQEDSNKLKVIYFSNEYPHDDLQDLFRRLHNHSKDKRHPLLASLFDETNLAVREEIRRLPSELKNLFPPFESIISLADDPELCKGRLSGSINGILLCVLQFATYLGYHEAVPRQVDDVDFENNVLVGLGLGLLTSTAVSISPTLEDLPYAAAEVIRIAFRMGVVVSDISQNLETPADPEGSPESWAYVVQGVVPEEAQLELDAIQARDRTPEAGKIFISAVSRTSVTVSGPPSRLKELFRTAGFFRDRKSASLPVFSGLCHAPHIYSLQDVRDVVQTPSLHARFWPRTSVVSTSTGRPFIATTTISLFEQIVSEIMTQQIAWDNVIQGVTERAIKTAANELEVMVFRTSPPVNEMIHTLYAEVPESTVDTEDLVPWIFANNDNNSKPRTPLQSKLAIVGMSCRMPGGATTNEKFWELLEKGYDVHKKIPADRFDVDSHCDPSGKRVNTSQTPYGCFIDEPGLFDAPFFNMSPREAEQTDPMQRLALVTAYEALEQAGYVANRTTATNLARIGTWYGQASDDYREVNTAQEISTYFIPGGCRAFGPGRINYFFKFAGPSFNCDTACSSSLATIQAACTALWAGDVDTVVAGGVNVLTNSDAFAGLCNGHFLSKTPNACKTWDSEADGYCRADGVGSIVIKRLEDAEADNDNIYGVILSAATNHSAEAVSITHPHAGAQSFLYRQVLSRAGIDPLDVSFVEMHGTGTQAGDSVEMESITNVFAPITKRRNAKQPLHIGAVKSNVGHGEAAAGVTAFLKVLLMLRNGAIPPHAGIKNSINPKFPKDLDKRNLRIPYERTEWPRVPGRKRIAAVNNFSAAGGNTTVLIEEGPVRTMQGTDPRPSHTITVSAKSKISLKGNIQRLLDYLNKNPDVSLADLSYSTTARRYHHNHRVTIHTAEMTNLKQLLTANLAAVESHQPIPSTGPPSVAFTFTGQGSSDKSMNLQLFHHSPYFRAQMLHLDSLAQRQGFASFIPAIDGTYAKDHEHSPVVTQLALVCTEIALAKYWETLNVKPEVVVGHSLGEYAALCIAGVFSASDAIYLVGTRAQMLEKKCRVGSHKMVAVKASVDEIAATASDLPYEIACINSPKSTVLSGTVQQMKAVTIPLNEAGYKCISLDVAFAFHSAQIDPILDELEEVVKSGIIFKEPKMPVISPLLGKVVFDQKTVNANYVRRATREAVNFVGALRNAESMSIVDKDTVWVEMGPHPVGCDFVKATLGSSANVAVGSLRRGENNWTTIARSLGSLHDAGVPISWNDFHKPFEKSLRLLELPTYSWNDKTYWIQYNGDWALTKGNTFYDAEKALLKGPSTKFVPSSIQTSTVQRIIEEAFEGVSGKVVMQSDLMQSEFLAAAYGHKMNGCGVVTSSIHGDIAYTLGQYLYNRLVPGTKGVDMNIANLTVLKGLVAQKNTNIPQLIQVSATTTDVNSGVVDLTWCNVENNGNVNEPFATANIFYGDAKDWLADWAPMAHLIESRIEALDRMAREGAASRFSHKMAYDLFGKNLVDYADKYRGMQSVVMHEFEAFAEVKLTKEKGGSWTVPPFFIDSVAHLAGFIMNVSDSSDTANTFCVTPGWRTMRFATPLTAGERYRSYVKMIQSTEDPTVYFGDVYILQNGIIIGMVGGIQFRRYPRILLNRFFSPPDSAAAQTAATNPPPVAPAKKPTPPPATGTAESSKTAESPNPAPPASAPAAVPTPAPASAPTSAPKPAPAAVAASADADPDSTTVKAMNVIATEAGLDLADLTDDATFANIGVDSLMSLVISEKFRDQLGITVGSSLFLEYPSIGSLRSWLEEYYN